jgi:hypothetical protein
LAHKDLKEQNVLLFKEARMDARGAWQVYLRAKVADLGLTAALSQRRDEAALL